MCSVPVEVPAADRARWLAEVSKALNEAMELLFELDLSAATAVEVGDLYHRIEAARFEVQTLQSSRSLNPRTQLDPNWIDFAPWHRNSEDAC